MEAPPLLVVDGVTKRFDEVVALEAIDLTFHRGDVVGGLDREPRPLLGRRLQAVQLGLDRGLDANEDDLHVRERVEGAKRSFDRRGRGSVSSHGVDGDTHADSSRSSVPRSWGPGRG